MFSTFSSYPKRLQELRPEVRCSPCALPSHAEGPQRKGGHGRKLLEMEEEGTGTLGAQGGRG